MIIKEKQLASKMLKYASDVFGYHTCNDVDEAFWEGWTIDERKKFVKEFHEWNGDPEEYDEKFLHIPDFAIMGFLAYKLIDIKDERKNKLNQLSNL